MNRKFKAFQIRWNEPLGNPKCPYAYRWVLNLWLFSIRIHKWLGSDDHRYMHDHPWNFITIVLKGSYIDVSEEKEDTLKTLSIRHRKAKHKHYVKILEPTITLVITGPRVRTFGYWVNGKFKGPIKYFKKYSHPICKEE